MNSIRTTRKVVFVRPNAKQRLYQELDSFDMTAIEPPLWCAMLAGYMRSRGILCDIIDAEAENLTPVQTCAQLMVMRPDYIVIVVSGSNPSASTMQMVGVRPLIDRLQIYVPKAKTVVYGLHPSALPEETLKQTLADYVCVGEGFRELAQLFLDGKSEHIIQTQSLIDLNLLPEPAWDMIDLSKYRAHNWQCFGNITRRQRYGVIYTSFGCPFKCDFCVIHTMFCNARKIRYRDIDLVMSEIRELASRSVRNIRIIDEMFTLNHDHVDKFCTLVKGEFGDSLNFWAYGRVGTLEPTLLAKLRSAGVRWLGVGFESGSQEVLDSSVKNIKLDQIMETVDMMRAADININANWIFGLPEDNYASMQETLSLALKIKADWANIYSCMAYPGSQLYTDSQSLPWYSKPETFSAYSQYSYDCLPLGTKHLTPAEVLKFRDEAFVTYYTNPEYLEFIERKFGEDTANYIRGITQVKLRRKLLGE